MNALFYLSWGFTIGFLGGWIIIYLVTKKQKD